MEDLSELIERRTEQFLKYLRLMVDRAHNEAPDRSCIIFASYAHDTDDDSAEESPPPSLSRRFIQFEFKPIGFCMDMPKSTLSAAEAEQINQGSEGFSYWRVEDPVTLEERSYEVCNPFRKIYEYGQAQSAAEDVAFIFFSVWKLPIDQKLFVSAHSWGDVPAWEEDEPLS